MECMTTAESRPFIIERLIWKPIQRFRKADDSFFDEGNTVCLDGTKQTWLDEEDNVPSRPAEIPCMVSSCKQVFTSLRSYESHYSSAHRFVCSDCHRTLPSPHLLDLHLLEWHDNMFQVMAEKQSMYQCLVETCKEKFTTAAMRKDHVIKVHKYPAQFRFDKPLKTKKKKKPAAENVKENDNVMEMESEDLSSGTQEMADASLKPARKFNYSVPKNICFGHGAQRGFARGRGGGKNRGRRKHWHQQEGGQPQTDTAVDISSVDMADLSSALDA